MCQASTAKHLRTRLTSRMQVVTATSVHLKLKHTLNFPVRIKSSLSAPGDSLKLCHMSAPSLDWFSDVLQDTQGVNTPSDALTVDLLLTTGGRVSSPFLQGNIFRPRSLKLGSYSPSETLDKKDPICRVLTNAAELHRSHSRYSAALVIRTPSRGVPNLGIGEGCHRPKQQLNLVMPIKS